MKRAIAYGLAVLLAVLLTAALVAMGWIFGTTAGARWTLQNLSRYTPLQISAARVEGRLLDSLRLEGIKVRSGLKQATIGQLEFQWRPAWLVTGSLVVDELVMAAVAVRDDTPSTKKPLDLSWPRLPGLADHVDVEIRSLRLTDLRYRHRDAKPVQVKNLSATISWRDGVLSLPSMTMTTDGGKVKGKMAAGFHRPSLAMDLVMTPAKPVAQMDSLSVFGRLLPATAPEQLVGPVLVAGSARGAPQLEVKTELGLTRNALNLRRLKIIRPGSRGTITGEGSINLAAVEPEVKLSLAAADLDLSRELRMPTDLSGSLTLTGSSKRYQGQFSIGNRGKGWRAAALSATFRGGDKGLSLAPLNGSMLGGTVAGMLEVGWLGGITAKGRLQGKNLDPARLAKDWTGEVNFNAAAEVVLPKQGSLQGKADVVLLESRLHGQPLTGRVKGELAGKNLQIANLDLHGRGFDLHGSGDVSRRFDLTAVVTDLSRLVPETAGELRLAGWGAWKDGRAAGSISGSGRKLKGRGMDIDNVNFEGRVPQGKDQPVHLAAFLQKAAYRQFQADSVRLKMDGRISDHLLSLEMTAPEASINLALAGSYSGGSWQGTINRFSGRDRIGPWRLLAPARLQASSAKLSLARMALAGTGRERLEARAEFSPGPVTGDVDVQWEAISLNRLTPWLQGVQVTGISNGACRFHPLRRPAFIQHKSRGAGKGNQGGAYRHH
ncbi:hypothetical protein [Geotalea toluenoxydans]|uniref:hypothetical protein n=1 Tax=Geotalea toluenoxydans TaxID=421624 RepID=UPI0006CFC8D6|nr:hypothetical protein [Geotalea toluenoxydans]